MVIYWKWFCSWLLDGTLELNCLLVTRCHPLCSWSTAIHSSETTGAARHIKEHCIPLDKTFATRWILPEIFNFTPDMTSWWVTYLNNCPLLSRPIFYFNSKNQHYECQRTSSQIQRNPITGLSQFTFRARFYKELKTFSALTKLWNTGCHNFTSLHRVLRSGAWELLTNIQTSKQTTLKSWSHARNR